MIVQQLLELEKERLIAYHMAMRNCAIYLSMSKCSAVKIHAADH